VDISSIFNTIPELNIFFLDRSSTDSSSADGYFLESGPLRFIDNTLTINKGGWHEFANVVFRELTKV